MLTNLEQHVGVLSWQREMSARGTQIGACSITLDLMQSLAYTIVVSVQWIKSYSTHPSVNLGTFNFHLRPIL